MAGQTNFYRITSFLSNYRGLFTNRPLVIHCPQATLTRESRTKLKALPEKPKKPMTAFFRFSQSRRHELLKSNPKMKITDIAKVLSEEWNNVDVQLKQKLEGEYKDDMLQYQKKNLEFSANLTEEQRTALKDISDEKRKDKQKRQLRKAFKDTRKPKRPRGPFIYFVMEKYHKNTDKNYAEFLQSAKSLWEASPEVEKQKFHDMYLDDKKRYELEMAEWEANMVKDGRTDLVRHLSLASLVPKRPVKPKYSETESPPSSAHKPSNKESTKQSSKTKSPKRKGPE